MTRVRPDESFDRGLQHERTALAWERTSVAMMVSGIILARHAASLGSVVGAAAGLLQTSLGGAVLVWTGVHYDDLHGPLRRGDDVVHPIAARLIGFATVIFVGVALVVVVAGAVFD